MARKNIFERLWNCWDMEYEANCLYRLLEEEEAFYCFGYYYSIMEYAENFCFARWLNRGHFLKLSDFLEALSYDEIVEHAAQKSDYFIDFVEIAYNIYYMARHYFEHEDTGSTAYEAYELFPKIADDCLAHFNHKIFYNEELEQAIVIEGKPEVTAVVEIEEDTDIAFEMVRYNHHTLKGNITAKRAILLKMGSQLEPLRSQISACNKALEKDIFFMLNNLNIRHNNCAIGDAKYKPFVASMDADTLENWYDELYQMILLAKLELANVNRMEQVEILKQNI